MSAASRPPSSSPYFRKTAYPNPSALIRRWRRSIQATTLATPVFGPSILIVVHRDPDPRSGRLQREEVCAPSGEVDVQPGVDEVVRHPVVPRPGQQIVVRRVVRPPLTAQQRPIAVPQTPGNAEQPAVERAQIAIDRLVRAAGQEHRQLHAPPLELAVVPQRRPGERGDGDRGGAVLPAR